MGWAQVLIGDLAGGGVPDRQGPVDGLATIGRNARSQRQMIEDLLGGSRVMAGQLRVDVQPVNLAAVVRAPAPAGVLKVAVQRREVHAQGGPCAGRAGAVGSHVEVDVIDTGRGIGADFSPFMSDRFRQADASSTRRHGGLGLAIASNRSVGLTSDR